MSKTDIFGTTTRTRPLIGVEGTYTIKRANTIFKELSYLTRAENAVIHGIFGKMAKDMNTVFISGSVKDDLLDFAEITESTLKSTVSRLVQKD